MRNTNLQGLIDGVMGNSTPSLYKTTIKFTSSTNSSYTFTPLHITNMLISQRFDRSFMDDIHLDFPIATADYAQMYDNMQNLMAFLTFQMLDKEGRVVINATPIKRSYRVSIVDARDVRRQFPDSDLRVTPDTKMTVRLIESQIYTIRQQAVVGTYRSTTMLGALYHAAQTFTISQAHIVTPDNTHTYDHIVVPPAQKFGDFFPWLQAKYGVYACGISHYYTGGLLYVFAPFDTNPSSPWKASFYQADQGAYGAAASFYQSDTAGNIKIVINNLPQSKDLSQSGSENKGTASMFLRASKLVDGAVTVTDSGITFNQDLALAVRLNNSKLTNGDGVNNVYTKATDNIFANMSMIIEHQANLVTVNWPNALPFSLYPGEGVIYYSNENGATMKRTGIVEYVEYALSERERTSAGLIMACMGRIVLRLQPIAQATVS